ncbi:MAG: HAMP domain-containing sensor histidine kinase [Betaproteobacteria bacterium]
MMYRFLENHRTELIDRCKAKVAARPLRAATEPQLANGVPMFLDQLTRTLRAEEGGDLDQSARISGASGGDVLALSEIGVSAVAHGASLLSLGYTVDQVVHDYGDLCQSITDMGFELDAPFAVDEFRTLNRCLDNAIADAVLEFSSQRDVRVLERHNDETRERVGFLVHELRNAVATATLAVAALEFGSMNMAGATGSVLKRSLTSLTVLINCAVDEVRVGRESERSVFSVASFIGDAEGAARLDANAVDCGFSVPEIDPLLHIRANRPALQAALANLLQNAFKFTRAGTEIVLIAHARDGCVLMEVHDHCGGLPEGGVESMFAPFTQRGEDRSGLGLGLAIARSSVEADLGTLTVHDVPGTGCVFTISLPLHAHGSSQSRPA